MIGVRHVNAVSSNIEHDADVLVLLDTSQLPFHSQMIGHSGWLECIEEHALAQWPRMPPWRQRIGFFPSRKEL